VARQYLQDGGFLEPAISDPLAANTATTAVGMYNSLRYALIPAYDSRPGKKYILEAGGLITTAATGALTISPSISTSRTLPVRRSARRSRRPSPRRRCRARGISG
jgi:hypothetical protein